MPSPTKIIPACADDLAMPAEWLRLGLQDAGTADFRSVVEDVLGQVSKPVRASRWGAFWATQIIENAVRAVGLCSYKREPNDLREVEIAYFTFPHREGHGIATAMVRELTDRASPHVARVIGHTLPVENASCRVLRRCGYERAGEVIDPEDGLVWRWRRGTTAYLVDSATT
jgi:ribosomal-protein-alanine N-acetyltransferase